MRNGRLLVAVIAIAAAWACSSAGSNKKPSDSSDADADADSDSDTDADSDTDTETETETETVAEGEWCDNEMGLCWQNPAVLHLGLNWYEAAGAPHTTLNPEGAVDYCGDLVWGGHSDWRLPQIDELIGLIRGCDAGIVAGEDIRSECGVVDPNCLDYTCQENDPECIPCMFLEGPDDDPPGCFWEPDLEGPCAVNRPYWSVSPYTHYPDYAWMVYFPGAAVTCRKLTNKGLVRCVRAVEGPD
jgi:hypothetical protein